MPRPGLARQQWRAWIETISMSKQHVKLRVSPASNGGRGLKQVDRAKAGLPPRVSPASNGGRGLKRPYCARQHRSAAGLARQQWRAWIETASSLTIDYYRNVSPASNGGRGLKLAYWDVFGGALDVSPASNGGRGLKPNRGALGWPGQAVSPASNGGRGLKLHPQQPALRPGCLARQQWRAWIETYQAVFLPRRQ